MKLGDFTIEPRSSDLVERWTTFVRGTATLCTYIGQELDFLEDDVPWPLYRADLAPTANISLTGYKDVVPCGGRSLYSSVEPWPTAVFEAIERYCASIPDAPAITIGPWEKDSGNLDPASLMPVSAEAEAREAERRRERSWIRGQTWQGNSRLVPCQSVYVPWTGDASNEPLLRDPVSTGTAAGMSSTWAAVRALLEVVERDANMLFYLGVAKSSKVDTHRLRPSTSLVCELVERRGLRLQAIRVDTNIPAHCVVVLIEDQRKVWPKYSLGTAASLDLNDAVEKGVLEAGVYKRNLRSRPGYFTGTSPDVGRIQGLVDRAAYWYATDRIGELACFQNTLDPLEPDAYSIEYAAETFIEHMTVEFEPIFVDLTVPGIAKTGVRVLKAVAPRLQPMHLNESLAAETERCAGKRFKDYPPHPFL